MKKLILFFLLTIASYGQNQSRLTSLEIEDTPSTSTGTYDVLTRNTSTNVVEKKASNFFQTALTNPITGTGTVNYAPKFTASGVLGNSIIYDNGSSIGIGTITPSGKLHISGFSNTTDVGQLILSEIDNPTRKLTIGVNNAANWGFLQMLVSGDNYYPFYMNPNGGNVGIGTTTDNGLDKLQVNGSISATNYTGSATLTGTPTAPTATVGTSTTQIATTAFVQNIVSSGTFTPSSTGGITFKRCYWVKTGNVLDVVYNFSITGATSYTATMTLPNSFTINSNSNGIDIGGGKVTTNSGYSRLQETATSSDVYLSITSENTGTASGFARASILIN